MTWSYSRITCFESCPYKFLLSYIKRVPKQRLFFSDYGLFMHKLIEKFLLKEIGTDELTTEYLVNFKQEVLGKAPTQSIFKNYFSQGLRYLNNLQYPDTEPVAIERRVDFFIQDKSFIGVIDRIDKNENGVSIIDNKSRALKPRSGRSKPTKSDRELDEYLRQLYMYSIPVHDIFGEYPKRLEFNCFRTDELVSEPFSVDALEKTKKWAIDKIDLITNNEDWSPCAEYWKCKHLCDVNHQCCYYQVNN